MENNIYGLLYLVSNLFWLLASDNAYLLFLLLLFCLCCRCCSWRWRRLWWLWRAVLKTRIFRRRRMARGPRDLHVGVRRGDTFMPDVTHLRLAILLHGGNRTASTSAHGRWSGGATMDTAMWFRRRGRRRPRTIMATWLGWRRARTAGSLRWKKKSLIGTKKTHFIYQYLPRSVTMTGWAEGAGIIGAGAHRAVWSRTHRVLQRDTDICINGMVLTDRIICITIWLKTHPRWWRWRSLGARQDMGDWTSLLHCRRRGRRKRWRPATSERRTRRVWLASQRRGRRATTGFRRWSGPSAVAVSGSTHEGIVAIVGRSWHWRRARSTTAIHATVHSHGRWTTTRRWWKRWRFAQTRPTAWVRRTRASVTLRRRRWTWRRSTCGRITTVGRCSTLTTFATVAFALSRAALPLDVHLLVARVAPSVWILLLCLDQLLVPIIVGGVGARLLHHVVDLASLSSG